MPEVPEGSSYLAPTAATKARVKAVAEAKRKAIEEEEKRKAAAAGPPPAPEPVGGNAATGKM